jgi:hypothetical protein
MIRPFLFAVAVLAAMPACSSGDGTDPSRGKLGRQPNQPPDHEPCEFTVSDYWGDCVVPPPVDPSEGVVAKYGPADYDDPNDVANYVVEPGTEPLDCGYTRLPNTADFFYNRYEVRSRPGMHHVILYAAALDAPDGTHDNCQIRDQGGRMLAVFQGGIEGGIYTYPPSGKMAPGSSRIRPSRTSSTR